MSTYKFEHGGGGGGEVVRGILSYTEPLRSQTFIALHRESMQYLNVFTTHRCVARCVTGQSQAKFLCHLIKFEVLRFFFYFHSDWKFLSVLFLFPPPSLYCARIIQRTRKNGLTLTHNLRSRS